MTDFNLSKTEFTAYLECPITFYLLKQRAQHTREGLRKRRSHKHYSAASQKGIRWHAWLNAFLQDHRQAFLDNAPPVEMYSHKYYQLLWEHERHRLAVDPDHWFPLAFEFYLRTPTLRGIIDRVDPIDEHSCCVVEYKSSLRTSGFLTEELLFYALLANSSPAFAQKIDRTVTHAACYCYSTGEYVLREVTPADLQAFQEYLPTVRQEMLAGNWSKRKNCSLLRDDCQFAFVCPTLPDDILIEL